MTDIPAMMLWTDAYMGDTSHLTTTEHGAYLLILMAMWRNGGTLPDDDVRLARTSRLTLDKWKKIAPTIRSFMKAEDGAITQKRLKLELEIATGKREKLSAAGASGGRAKALKNKHQHSGDATQTPVASLKQPEPEPEKEKTPPKGGVSASAPHAAREVIVQEKPAKETRLDESWRPSEDDLSNLAGQGITRDMARKSFVKFQNYWISKSGKGATKRNWGRTFQNWCIDDASKLSANGARAGPRRDPETRNPFLMDLPEDPDERPNDFEFQGSFRTIDH